ncbi:hypothetical protein GGTG_04625 [Gaeumannomyces tritici R3-111a-1]|uniref:Uncharacterized protein n=1 Tax=Gaeumannomyces tritici (strain R3-111a-1) TaxID=644352 RepID=J3NTM5_GAET3|nr:hypothetical protein GGTG_04625 [Gaeumannomyces tritici R3-111a-1]EJT79540.1 hypothetical protein GGTG_04625 [Gaeumannomyces tritici R3-111a-1]
MLGTAAAGVTSVKKVVSQPRDCVSSIQQLGYWQRGIIIESLPDDVHDEIVGSHPGMSGHSDMIGVADALDSAKALVADASSEGALETIVDVVADGPYPVVTEVEEVAFVLTSEPFGGGVDAVRVAEVEAGNVIERVVARVADELFVTLKAEDMFASREADGSRVAVGGALVTNVVVLHVVVKLIQEPVGAAVWLGKLPPVTRPDVVSHEVLVTAVPNVPPVGIAVKVIFESGNGVLDVAVLLVEPARAVELDTLGKRGDGLEAVGQAALVKFEIGYRGEIVGAAVAAGPVGPPFAVALVNGYGGVEVGRAAVPFTRQGPIIMPPVHTGSDVGEANWVVTHGPIIMSPVHMVAGCGYGVDDAARHGPVMMPPVQIGSKVAFEVVLGQEELVGSARQGPDMGPPVQVGRDALIASVKETSVTGLVGVVGIAVPLHGFPITPPVHTGMEALHASVNEVSTTELVVVVGAAVPLHGPTIAPPLQKGREVFQEFVKGTSLKDVADVVGGGQVAPMQGPDIEPPVHNGSDALIASVRDVSYTELESVVVVAGSEPLKASTSHHPCKLEAMLQMGSGTEVFDAGSVELNVVVKFDVPVAAVTQAPVMLPLPQRLPVGPTPGRVELVQGKGGVDVGVCEAPIEQGPVIEPAEQREGITVVDVELYSEDEKFEEGGEGEDRREVVPFVGSADAAVVSNGRVDMPKVSVPVGPTGIPVELERGNGAAVDTADLDEGGLEMPVPLVDQVAVSVALRVGKDERG